MSTTTYLCFEERRKILEELEVIEDAISSRLRRNPEIFYRFNEALDNLGVEALAVPKIDVSANRIYRCKKSKRSRKQIKAQEYEIALFLGRYRRLLKSLQKHKLSEEHLEYFRDAKASFEQFETVTSEILEGQVNSRSLVEVKSDYEMFSGPQGASKNIMSPIGQIIDLSRNFTRDENFGMYLDLSEQFKKWLNIIKRADLTMLSFLKMLESFGTYDYLLKPSLDRDTKEYNQLLAELLKYYKAYYSKAYPLVDKEILSKTIHNGFDKYVRTGITESPSKESGKMYSVVFNRWFDSQSEFNTHLQTEQFNIALSQNRKRLMKEYTFHCFSKFLSKVLQNTISFTERKLAFTDEEFTEELEKLQGQYESPIYAKDESEDKPAYVDNAEDIAQKESTDPTNPYNLPLGPDGFPIPRWLIKVQGLDVKYVCEICGNQIYHGRREFEKHFPLKKHSEGLKSLGITPSPAFKDVTTIAEVTELWKALQAKSTLKAGEPFSKILTVREPEMVLETEDNEGNVMSIQVYDELKKQGLL
ncbi:Prp9 [Kluyveromyces lactis]|nr:Prp9 [Kluyveromyces lactis]